jgi:hypothetical protein
VRIIVECKKQKRIPHAGVIFWLSLFLLIPVNCKNTTAPDNGITTARIIVSNECGVAVDIYMDKNFQFSVEYQENRTIQNVSLGEHEFEAKKKDTEILLSFVSVELTETEEFVLTIQSEASFHVTNEYGESLNIYGDGELLSDMSSPSILVIQHVLYGVHLFEAKKVSDGITVASISIDLAENKAYFWTINN